jgi:hypothetical protein
MGPLAQGMQGDAPQGNGFDQHLGGPMSASPALNRSALVALLALGCTENSLYKLEGDDVFYQNPAGEVDVLLVVDNSCSMQPYQNKLATNFNEFLTYFVEGDVDYHIGVVTTSVIEPYPNGTACSASKIEDIPPGGELNGGTYITPETDGGDELFSDLVKVGVCGNYYEMGLESAYLAVTEPIVNDANAGFLREDAYLSMIFVSDEQDASPMDVSAYLNAFREVKGQRNRDIFNASALVVTNEDECTAAQAAASDAGTRYVDVATQTGGIIGNLCAENFGAIVTELGLASSRLSDAFPLSQLPDAASITVGVDDALVGCNAGAWWYELRGEGEDVQGTIVFDRQLLPPPGSKISVTYDLGNGDPSTFCTGGE